MRLRTTYFAVGALLVSGAVIELEACGGDNSVIDSGVIDAPTVDIGPPFAIGLSPSHITEDIGDTYQVTVSLVQNFGYNVTFSVSTAAGLSIKHPTLLYPPFTIDVTAVSVPASGPDATITITGTSGSIVETATLGVHIGSRLMPDDAGVVTIPSFASSISVKIWGAGGGGGPDCTYNAATYQGETGGGGGFALVGSFLVVPGETFRVVEGTGGGAVTTIGQGGGGGGGGYSAFMHADGGIIALAGGGGGGTAGYCQYPPSLGNPGGAAGGTNGGDGASTFALGGLGAHADAGGAGGGNGGAGSSFSGGAGGGTGNPIAGGTPGGGAGNGGTLGGAGGGGGHFGGGGGGAGDGGTFGSGSGGGGCSWTPKDPLGSFAANGSLPGNATDSDIGDAGAGIGQKGNGGPGRVVVLVPKP